MRDLGLLPAPTYIQNLDHSLLNYLDVQFRRIEENWRILDSASSSGLHVPAGNIVAGTFGSNVGGGAYSFVNSQVVFESAAADNVIVRGAGGTIRIEDRAGGGDFFALYMWNDHYRLWSSVGGIDRAIFENTGRAIFGASGNGAAICGPWMADGSYAFFGNLIRAQASASHYGMLVTGGDNNVYIAGTDLWFRLANNGSTMMVIKSEPSIEMWVAQGGMKHKFWSDGEFWCNSVGVGGDNGYNNGIVIQNGWFRNVGNGWHTEGLAGEMGATTFGVADVTTNNNQTTIVARRISQGGWADAGLSSYGESSSMVPWLSLHASGCCTSNWRKDSGQSYMVVVNSGGGCDWVYAANHPICSERARKHNIAVAEEYGLKTLRGLKPHKFQYVPTSEDEIWAWEKWKHDRAIGIWTVPPSEHMGWDDWHIGFFAEEMVNLVPEVVGLHADGTPKGIDYGNLVVVAIAAINELADRIEDLEARMYATA